MSITLDLQVPYGFKATGELRVPNIGEFYLLNNNVAQEVIYSCLFPVIILKKTSVKLEVNLVAPEGFKFTGEFRRPKFGGYVYRFGTAIKNIQHDFGEGFILEKVETLEE
jgi:hypothetical protein